MFIRDLIYNIALVVSLSVVLQFVRRRLDATTMWGQIVSGLLFGGAIVLGMMTPVRVAEGLIYDGRSIVLAAAGVLGGPVVAGIAALIGALYRAYLGGGGTFVGISVIVEAATLGTIFYYLRRRNPGFLRARSLLGLGMVVHVIMVLLMLILPGGMSQTALREVAPIVLTAYPIATAVVCRYLLDDEQRVEYRDALEKSEEQLKLAIEGSGTGLWDWHVSDGRIWVNERWAEMLGYSLDEISPLTREKWRELVHPDDVDRVTEAIRSHVRGETPLYEAEMRMRRKGGGWAWVLAHGQAAARDSAGSATRVTGTHMDITARVETSRALEHSNETLERMLVDTAVAMGKLVEARDPYTQGHQRRVARLARSIAERMGMPEHDVDGIEMAALLHDVGKTAVPAEILTKPGTLSANEFAIIQGHPESGQEILACVEFPWPIAEIVVQHHERMDGSGYPFGLTGDEICIGARIIAVADVVEAMASHRPYRGAKGLESAIEELRDNPSLYDGTVAAACIGLHEAGLITFEP